MRGVGAKGRVDAGTAAPERAQRGRFEAGQGRMPGIHDKGAQECPGIALEQVGCARFQQGPP